MPCQHSAVLLPLRANCANDMVEAVEKEIDGVLRVEHEIGGLPPGLAYVPRLQPEHLRGPQDVEGEVKGEVHGGDEGEEGGHAAIAPGPGGPSVLSRALLEKLPGAGAASHRREAVQERAAGFPAPDFVHRLFLRGVDGEGEGAKGGRGERVGVFAGGGDLQGRALRQAEGDAPVCCLLISCWG